MKLFKPLSIVFILLLSGYWLWWGSSNESKSLEGSKVNFGSTKATSLKQSNLKLGLDLIGGAQLIFQASPTEQTPKINQQVMDGLLKVIENRVNASGTTEATVQQVGVDRIMVEIPGVNPELVKRRLLKTAKLEFKERKMDLQGKSPQEILQMRSQIDQYEWVSSGVTGADLKGAQISPDQSGTNWTIAFELKPEGAKKFSEVTGRLAEYTLPLGIFLDDKLVSDPVVQSQISQNGQITGSFTIDEAKDLSVQLNAGALPVPVNLISERTVGATLGQDSINKSLQAGLIGLGLVGIFMVLIYRMPGLLATLALMAYTLISLGVFTRGITLTLAGIAGFILSIGMAVDANILIFERIKEELRNGKAIYKAVEEGFHRAFPSIFDSNLNTLIVCVILGIFGTGLVRGFAITLAVGVIVSFFSAITITRQLVDLTLLIPALKNPIWYGVDNKKKEVIES